MFAYNTLEQGDCRSVLRTIPSESFDLALTDPPYFVNYRDRLGRAIANDGNDFGILTAFDELYRVLKPDTFCISFYGWGQTDTFFAAWRRAGFRPVGHIVWCKPYASRISCLKYRHEQAYLLARGRPRAPANPLDDVRRWQYSGNRCHPTEKSIAILKPLIESFSSVGGAVIDPFAGSGSSLLAAAQCGRRYFGIELDSNHCATIRERLAGLPGHSSVDRDRDLDLAFAQYGRWLSARGVAMPPGIVPGAFKRAEGNAGRR